MMRKGLLILLLLLLLAAPAAFGCLGRFEVKPENPGEGEFVELFLGGGCCNGNGPDGHWVRRDGNSFHVHIVQYDSSGPAIVVPWAERVMLGRLAAGTYRMKMDWDLNGCEEERTFVVRERPFDIVPAFGTKGASVTFERLHRSCLGTWEVSFGNTTVKLYTENGRVTVPELEQEGVVDVTLKTHCGTFTFPAAFRYGEPREEDFEPVLFPMTMASRGRHGSDWTSEVFVHRLQFMPNLFTIPALTPDEQGRARFPVQEAEGGSFLYVPRGMTLDYSARVVGRSGTSRASSVEIPVVRSRDTSADVAIYAVPLDADTRVRLRVYDFDHTGFFALFVTPDGKAYYKGAVASVPAQPVCRGSVCLPAGPAYASFDLSAMPELRGHESVDVFVGGELHDARLWAFVSATDNETQHVSVYTPQREMPPQP